MREQRIAKLKNMVVHKIHRSHHSGTGEGRPLEQDSRPSRGVPKEGHPVCCFLLFGRQKTMAGKEENVAEIVCTWLGHAAFRIEHNNFVLVMEV